MDALHGVTDRLLADGHAAGADLHAGRLRMLWEKLVDTPVRGVVYEGALPAGRGARARGARRPGRSRSRSSTPTRPTSRLARAAAGRGRGVA